MSDEKAAKRAKKMADLERAKTMSYSQLEEEVYEKYKDELTFSWLGKGFLSPVKDQEDCNCCWAIVSAGAVESQYVIGLNGETISLEEWELAPQELVDCLLDKFPHAASSSKRDERGCYESSYTHSFEYIKTCGLNTEKVYPFKAWKEQCQCESIKDATFKVYIEKAERVDKENEDKVNDAIRKHPLPCGFTATPKMMKQFGAMDEDDIFEGDEEEIEAFKKANKPLRRHALLIVGYGKGKKAPYTPYFLVKNSWGLKFGKFGYGRIARSKLVGQMRRPTNAHKK